MPRRYWLPAIAIGLTLGIAGMALAKAPDQQRVPSPRPAIEKQTSNTADSKPHPTEQSPLPVRIIESAADTKHTQAREAKTDRHDAEDLQTQKRAVEATEKQVPPAWVAAILTFFGTALLVWNLVVARQANAHARQAIDQSERHSRLELRAYVAVSPYELSIDGVGKPVVQILIENTGKTSAKDVQAYGILDIVDFSNPATIKLPRVTKADQPPLLLHPGQRLNGPLRPAKGRNFSYEEMRSMCNGKTHRLCAFGHVSYTDIYDEKWEATFAATLSGGEAMDLTMRGLPLPENYANRFEFLDYRSYPQSADAS